MDLLTGLSVHDTMCHMTAIQAVTEPPVTEDAAIINRTISRTVKALLGYRDMEVAEFCARAGMKEPTYFSRQRGTEWKAAEVKRAADVLGVDVATLFLGLPHLDSNQKPAG